VGRRERYALQAYATHALAALPHTAVYLDAGRSDWRPAGEMIAALRASDVAEARGFTLDVTGYAATRNELRYGDRIARALGRKHFVVNTSRNGRGALPRSQVHNRQDTWCNTPGRALGPRPSAATGDPLADAFEWVLHPGYSDGPCNGGPNHGWWPEYALGLAQRAAY
jgi:endoglucanase